MYFLMYFLAALDHYNSFRVVCVSLKKYFKGENLRIAKSRFFPLFPIVSFAKFFKKSKFKINYLLKNYQYITKFMFLTWLSTKVISAKYKPFWLILGRFVSVWPVLGRFLSFFILFWPVLCHFGSFWVVLGPFGSFFELFWLVLDHCGSHFG